MEQDAQAMARAMRAYQRQDYEKNIVAESGAGGAAVEMAGPPNWSRESWDAFHRQYGFYPFSASELPPSFEGCPDWAYSLMNLRKPPMAVRPA